MSCSTGSGFTSQTQARKVFDVRQDPDEVIGSQRLVEENPEVELTQAIIRDIQMGSPTHFT
jgi:hypothetical protein